MTTKRRGIINGYHVSTTANTHGIGAWIKKLDAAGVPVMFKAVRSTAGLMDLQEAHAKSGIEHIAVYRQDQFKHNQGGDDVPDYNMDPVRAARLQWDALVEAWPGELDPSWVWAESINELREGADWGNWIGAFCHATGLLALQSGRRWMGPGYASGNPEIGAWYQPGMVNFLRLASENRGRLGVALHEYSLNPDDLFDQAGHLIGRVQYLVEACEAHGFAPPDIYFTEWGWSLWDLPEPDQAITEIDQAMRAIYAQFGTVKGSAIWALDRGWKDIDKKAHDLMEPLGDLLINSWYDGGDPVDPTTPKNLVQNWGFADGQWETLDPISGGVKNQRPFGWLIEWAEVGDQVRDFEITGMPECIVKPERLLPEVQHFGADDALILSGPGSGVYKMFSSGAKWAAKLSQVITGLEPGGTYAAVWPVRVHAHDRPVDYDPKDVRVVVTVGGQEAILMTEDFPGTGDQSRHPDFDWLYVEFDEVVADEHGEIAISLAGDVKYEHGTDIFTDAVVLIDISDPGDPPKKVPMDTSNIRFQTNLIPQDTTEPERDEIARITYPAREGIEYSADFAGLAGYGREDSAVVVWGADRWSGDIVKYLTQNYGVNVVLREMPVINGNEYPIPADRDDMPILIDVSKWQARRGADGTYIPDTIDWDRVFGAGNVQGVNIRTSVGANVDPVYKAWVHQVATRKKPRGNYHFLHPAVGAGRQFDVFMGHRVEGVLGDWLDVERYGEQVPTADQVVEFMQLYRAETGKPIGIYTNFDTWFYYIKLGLDIVGDSDLWIASFESYPGSLSRPVVPLPWDRDAWGQDNTTLKLWQYQAGELAGYDREIDINAWHGSQEAFDQMIEDRGGVITPEQIPDTKPVLIGLHAGADGGRLSQDERAEFASLQPGVIKVLSSTAPGSVGELAADHPGAVFIVRAFLSMHGRNVTPAQFVDWTLPDVERTVNAIGLGREIWIELHNEPNLVPEGLGSSWQDGTGFDAWLRAVIAKYRAALPTVKLLYPGLSPGGDIHELRAASDRFRAECQAAIAACDGLAIHVYWASGTGWPIDRAVVEARVIATQYNGVPIWVTEASNNKDIDGVDVKAAEYARLPGLLDQARDNIRGVTYFVASASNPAWGWGSVGSAETWVEVGMGARVRGVLDG